MTKTAVTWLGLACFFAGAAFQESIEGCLVNHADGSYGSLIFALYAAAMGWKMISRRRADAG